jgi:hypothetical protein
MASQLGGFGASAKQSIGRSGQPTCLGGESTECGLRTIDCQRTVFTARAAGSGLTHGLP